MTKILRRLAVSAVLLSSVPLAASADGWHDGARPDGWSGPEAPAYPAPPPAAYPGRLRDAREWRERRSRERELAEVTAQLRELDAQRDRFHAENRYRPGKLRRYDRGYAARRAELERRYHELQIVAWR